VPAAGARLATIFNRGAENSLVALRYKIEHPVWGRRYSPSFDSGTFGVSSALGRVRASQEDAALVVHHPSERHALLGVFDGMGGHHDGERASAAALEHFRAGAPRVILPPEESSSARELRLLSDAAHGAVVSAVGTEGERVGGTTAAVVAIEPSEFHVAHCGDSRVYHIQRGQARQVTQDHVVEALDSRGVLRFALTRALGGGLERSTLDIRARFPLRRGDRIVLVSDGVTRHLLDAEIASIVGGAVTAQRAATRLVAEAVKRGGRDNATAVVYVHNPSRRLR